MSTPQRKTRALAAFALVAACQSHGPVPTTRPRTLPTTCADYNDAGHNARARAVRRLATAAQQDLSNEAVAGYLRTADQDCATNPDRLLSSLEFAQKLETEPRPAEIQLVTKRLQLLLGYDYRSLAQTESRAQAVTAGEFWSTYLHTFDTTVKPAARARRAVVTASVVGVGLLARGEDSATYLAFVNQTTVSTLATGPKVDLSRVRLTVASDGKVSELTTADPTTGSQAGKGQLADLQNQAAETILPVLTIDSRQIDADLQKVLDNATGSFATEFRARSAELRTTLVANAVVADAPLPLVAVVAVTPTSLTVLAAADSRVTNKAAPQGRNNTYRVRVTFERAAGRLLISSLQFVG